MSALRASCLIGLVCFFLAACGPAPTDDPPGLVQTAAPELEGGISWINSRPLKLADLRGRVVLLNFFDYSCVNCLRVFPYLQEWQRRYADAGLVVIGVHTPQYEFSADPRNVYAAVMRSGLTYPVVVDSDGLIAEAYDNRFWPRTFLVDQAGVVRFDHTGEGAYIETERQVQELLAEINPARAFVPLMEPVHDFDRPDATCYPITPELYLGHLRGALDSPSTVLTNGVTMYRLPESIEAEKVYAQGAWDNQAEYLRHTRDTEALEDFILLRYDAVEVNAVMKPEDIYWKQVFVQRDGAWLPRSLAGTDITYDDEGRSYVRVDQARMYNLIRHQPYGHHQLRLYTTGLGLSVYSFSFGTCVIPDATTAAPAAGKESP